MNRPFAVGGLHHGRHRKRRQRPKHRKHRTNTVRRLAIILPAPPDDPEKYTYIDRQLPYLAVIMVIGSVAAT